MRAFLSSGLTLAAATLAACALQATGMVAPEPGMAWSLYETPDEGLKLAFGKPGSDDVAVLLTCRPKSGRVSVNIEAPSDGAGAEISLSSGPVTSRLHAASQPDLGEGSRLEAVAAAPDPALQRFAVSGVLALEANGHRMAPSPALPVQSGKFIKMCTA